MASTLSLDLWPLAIWMLLLGIPSFLATSATSASLALPSSGGTVTHALSFPPSTTCKSSRRDLGCTLTAI